MARERGFALLVVLWALVLAAWLVGRLADAGGAEARIAGNLRDAAAQEMQADADVQEAAFALLDNRAPDPARIVVRDQSDLVNVATAPAPLVAALLAGCGAPATRAEALARAIEQRRGPALRGLADLAAIPGLDAALRARLLPHVTLFSEYGPGAATADPMVADAVAAVRRAGGPLPDDTAFGHARVVSVTSAREKFVRRAVLRLAPADPSGPLAILAWEREGAGQAGAAASGTRAGSGWPR